MKFTVLGYTIDTEKETDFNGLGEKLTILASCYYPELNVQNVVYDHDASSNVAKMIFVRESKSFMDSGWIKEDDCQLITAMGKEYFYPEAYGGKDNGYFMLVAYAGSWYAADDRVKKYFMDYQAEEDVKDVDFYFNDRHLEIKVIGV